MGTAVSSLSSSSPSSPSSHVVPTRYHPVIGPPILVCDPRCLMASGNEATRLLKEHLLLSSPAAAADGAAGVGGMPPSSSSPPISLLMSERHTVDAVILDDDEVAAAFLASKQFRSAVDVNSKRAADAIMRGGGENGDGNTANKGRGREGEAAVGGNEHDAAIKAAKKRFWGIAPLQKEVCSVLSPSSENANLNTISLTIENEEWDPFYGPPVKRRYFNNNHNKKNTTTFAQIERQPPRQPHHQPFLPAPREPSSLNAVNANANDNNNNGNGGGGGGGIAAVSAAAVGAAKAKDRFLWKKALSPSSEGGGGGGGIQMRSTTAAPNTAVAGGNSYYNQTAATSSSAASSPSPFVSPSAAQHNTNNGNTSTSTAANNNNTTNNAAVAYNGLALTGAVRPTFSPAPMMTTMQPTPQVQPVQYMYPVAMPINQQPQQQSVLSSHPHANLYGRGGGGGHITNAAAINTNNSGTMLQREAAATTDISGAALVAPTAVMYSSPHTPMTGI